MTWECLSLVWGPGVLGGLPYQGPTNQWLANILLATSVFESSNCKSNQTVTPRGTGVTCYSGQRKAKQIKLVDGKLGTWEHGKKGTRQHGKTRKQFVFKPSAQLNASVAAIAFFCSAFPSRPQSEGARVVQRCVVWAWPYFTRWRNSDLLLSTRPGDGTASRARRSSPLPGAYAASPSCLYPRGGGD